MDTERIIGIDFGTSTSVVRVKRYQDGKPVGDGGRLDTKELVFGGLYQTVPTVIQRVGNNTYYGHDAMVSRGKSVTYQGFKVDLESGDQAKKQQARELTEEFLHYLATVYREQSDGGHLGEAGDKERTMISYPVKWSDETKKFMREAAKRAGFPNVEGMDEAQAAIHAVTLQSEDHLKRKGYLMNGKPCTILLIDMGAGTTDLVLCRYTPGPNPTNEILCTWPKSGQILFGGQEADEVLRKYIRSILPAEDANEVMKRLDRKKNNYKTWKETVVSPALSRNETVEEFSELDYIVDDLEIDMDEYALNRAGFETFARDYLLEFPQLVRGCLKEAHISADEVDLAILTGGHSQWYFASEMLRGGLPQICEPLLPKTKAEPGRIISATRPQETVALGLVYSPMSMEIDTVTERKQEDYKSNVYEGTINKFIGIELLETGIRAAQIADGDTKIIYEEKMPYVPLYDRYSNHNLRQALEKCKRYFASRGITICKCVASVPAGMDYGLRKQVREAFHAAGLDLRMISNLGSMALAYEHTRVLGKDEDESILIIDTRGGFTDIGIAEVGEKTAELLAVAEISEISSGKQNAMTAEQQEKLSDRILEALREAEKKPEEIDGILISDNCTDSTTLKKIFSHLFEKKSLKRMRMRNGVLRGLAVLSATKEGIHTRGKDLQVESDPCEVLLLESIPWNIGIALTGESMATIISKNATIPCAKGVMLKYQGSKNPAPDRESLSNHPIKKKNYDAKIQLCQNGGYEKSIAEIPITNFIRKHDADFELEVRVGVDADYVIDVRITDLTDKTSEKYTI